MRKRDIAETIEDIYGFEISHETISEITDCVLDEIKIRGVEDVLFISMDGVSGPEEGAKVIFKDVTVRRCIVHLIRNSIKYMPGKDYNRYTQALKKVYGASSLTASLKAFEQFCNISEYLSFGILIFLPYNPSLSVEDQLTILCGHKENVFRSCRKS